MLKGILEAIGGNFVIVWVMFILCPVYIFLGNGIALAFKNLWLLASNKNAIIFQTVGDITWLFPFQKNKDEIRLTDTILIAVLCAVLSLVIVASMIFSSMEQRHNARLQKEVQEATKQKKTN